MSQLVWEGRELPLSVGAGWMLSCTFKIGHGERGYYNRVESIIRVPEWESHGPGILLFVLHGMIKEVREAAYRALCNNALVFAIGQDWDRIAPSYDDAWKVAARTIREIPCTVKSAKE